MSGKNIPRLRRIMKPEDIDKRNRKIVDARKSGASFDDIRSRFGLGEDSIRDILRRAGVPAKNGRPSL